MSIATVAVLAVVVAYFAFMSIRPQTRRRTEPKGEVSEPQPQSSGQDSQTS